MRPWPSAMAQDFIAGAASFEQRLGQFRHPLECTVVVNRLCQAHDIRREPVRVDRDYLEWVAEYITGKTALASHFAVKFRQPSCFSMRVVHSATASQSVNRPLRNGVCF